MAEYKVGDTVCFEECWEDVAGHYHDETATIKKILPDGVLKLRWHVKSWKIKAFLNSCTFTVEDIASMA